MSFFPFGVLDRKVLGTCIDFNIAFLSIYCLLLANIIKTNEPAHDKTYNKTCATSEDSDQPLQLRSPVRVFADRKHLLHPPGYPVRDKREPLPHWVDADLILCWLHVLL